MLHDCVVCRKFNTVHRQQLGMGVQAAGRSGTAAQRLAAGREWSAMWRASSRSGAPSLARSTSHRPACSPVWTQLSPMLLQISFCGNESGTCCYDLSF